MYCPVCNHYDNDHMLKLTVALMRPHIDWIVDLAKQVDQFATLRARHAVYCTHKLKHRTVTQRETIR